MHYCQGDGTVPWKPLNHWYCETATNTQPYDIYREGLGAAVLMYKGKVLQFGGLPSATEIFDPEAETWTVGPTPSIYLDQVRGPASLEPNRIHERPRENPVAFSLRPVFAVSFALPSG